MEFNKKNDADFSTKSSDLLKELKSSTQQKKGTMMQFWAKQSTALPKMSVCNDVTRPIEFSPNSSQFDEIDSDFPTKNNDSVPKAIGDAKAAVSKHKEGRN